jgi:excisionase family DNA binding protein
MSAPRRTPTSKRLASPRTDSIPLAVSLNEPLLTVEAAAELLNVKVSWIREATRTGMLPCIKVGRQVRWTRPMLEQWLAQHQTHP